VVVVDEYAPGFMGVAAPVHRPDGAVVASLNISGPAWRLAGAVDTLRVAVGGAADELDAVLAA
jgi:DNA-binding IclR family transcriptional regulator